MVARESRLLSILLALAKQKLAETGLAETQEHPQTKRALLKSSTLPTDPAIVGESIFWHLDELVLDAQASCTIITNMSHLVPVANTCTRVGQNRLCSTGCSCTSRLLNTILGLSATVGQHWYTSHVKQPGHTVVTWMQDRRTIQMILWNQRKQLTITPCIEEPIDEGFAAKTKMFPICEQLRSSSFDMLKQGPQKEPYRTERQVQNRGR